MPVGPVSDPAFVHDTIASVYRHMPDAAVVIADNTRAGLQPFASDPPPAIEYLRFPSDGAWSAFGQLYFNLTRCLERILAAYDFEVVLRLDDDALVIGADPDAAAAAYFRDYPHVACLGSYRVDCAGQPRSFAPPARILRRELSPRAMLTGPRRWLALRSLYAAARRNGYEDGEHCLGAACFFSQQGLRAMQAMRLFASPRLMTANLGDDHMFGLMVRAAGLELGDFAFEGPLGLAHRGLPMSPAELVGCGKKVVHSLKDHGGRTQAQLRAEFHRLVDERKAA